MKLTNRFFIYYPEILAGLVVLILSAAFIMQYFFGFLPCKLCEIQRIPYYFILLVSVFYFCAKKSFKLLYVYLVMLACFIGAFVSFYHAGIEYGFFKNILNCESLTLENIILISAYGVGNSLNNANPGIKIMNNLYLQDVYRAKNAQEELLNNYKKNKLLINDNEEFEEFEEGEILDEDNNPKIKGWDIKY